MLLNIIHTVLVCACRGGRGVQNACCGVPCRNCPISRFSTGAIVTKRTALRCRRWKWLLGRDGQWVITVSYSIGIVGAVRLWEAADPKDQNCVGIAPLYLKCSIVCQTTTFELPSSGITSVGMQVLSCDIWTPEIFGPPMQILKTNFAIQTLETNPANHSYPEPSPWPFWISAIVDNMQKYKGRGPNIFKIYGPGGTKKGGSKFVVTVVGTNAWLVSRVCMAGLDSRVQY